MPVLFDGADSPHGSFFFAYHSQAALRQGNWKIVRQQSNESWQLFDLAQDLGESHDLASSHAARVAELEQVFRGWQNSF